MRLIDADAYIKEHEEEYKYSDQWETGYFWDGILNAPTIDAELVRHGTWDMKKKKVDLKDITYIATKYFCSECKQESRHPYNYCPHCGAKMDGDIR